MTDLHTAAKQDIPDLIAGALGVSRGTAYDLMREALAEQSAQQEPVAYGMWDTMLGKGNRMMMVRLDKGQDGCTVPLYTSPPAQQEPVAWICYGAPGKRDIDFDEADINDLPIGTLLYTSPPAQRKPLTDEQIDG